jgi:hypothetical protein|nr:MAG TPA: hypothetical protein [Crassvirales sp.]
MKHFLYHIIGEVILTSLLIFSTICLYNQAQIINKQREFIDELQFNYYKLEEYKEVINLADIIFDNNNIWAKDKSETMSEYINIRCNIDSTFYEGFHNNVLLDSISYMYNE